MDKSTEQVGDAEIIEVFVPDLNGVARGKWVSRAYAAKAFAGGIRLPRSAVALDIWGQDVEGTGLLFESGDGDAVCVPAIERALPMPWLKRPTSQMLMTMQEADGTPFFGDARQVLKGVQARFIESGLTPVMAIELEFYLLDRTRDSLGCPQPPLSPISGIRQATASAYAMEDLHDFEDLLRDVAYTCEIQKVPANSAVAENSPGQYEINLDHVADAVTAADHALLLKRTIKGHAEARGLSATFMAKPWGDRAGNGMHVHFSLFDSAGRNVFDDGTPVGSGLLRAAVAGMTATIGEAMALLAPHANSYRRFVAGSYAPLSASWGYDNRTTALRIPLGTGDSMRIEHRVAGADANPYLVLAAILAGAHHGIVNRLEPQAPIASNAYARNGDPIPITWERALEQFDRSTVLKNYLGADFCRLFSVCRRHERELLLRQVTDVEYRAYLRTV